MAMILFRVLFITCQRKPKIETFWGLFGCLFWVWLISGQKPISANFATTGRLVY